MIIAVIPARGGSKRIPRKNVKLFMGLPMITYSINAALNSKLFDKVIVSTDDHEICSIAKGCGAEVPFFRPDCLSDDYTPTVPVIQHTIDYLMGNGLRVDAVCCIYPCAPLININDLIEAFSILKENSNKYVFPVVKFQSSIRRALKKECSTNAVAPFFAENELVRTQDLDDAYFDSGSFYLAKKKTWLTSLNIHSNSVVLEVPFWRGIDIDDEEDWVLAENMCKFLRK
ncbi:pseudaminic acid cytidylyltransferase [Candidatus Puniceispirillum sp.]|nr:pseudaminic acid cytidylyltransferase [Candidatus Puniceispirillum sp.]